jgi:hypothetical protein
VAEFLAGLGKPAIVETTRSDALEKSGGSTEGRIPQRPAAGTSRSGKVILRGKAYPYTNAKEAMVIVLRELAKNDPSFLSLNWFAAAPFPGD